jgi:hypothetical protein
VSFLGGANAATSANRRTVAQSPVASNILGTPWPTLWGLRGLNGTVIAWTNHTFNSGGSAGKGGGQVSSGEKDYRTFALGLCIGPVDRITEIWYDNELIWQGNVGIASAATVATSTVGIGGVVLTDSLQRGTITFYFGLDTQTQDPVLAKFIPDAPFYRGMCYAVFHGPRTGTKGFRLGNADTLAQVALYVERIPSSLPGLEFTLQTQAAPQNSGFVNSTATFSVDASAFTGANTTIYQLNVQGSSTSSTALVTVSALEGSDTGGAFVITSGTPFTVGAFGVMATLAWSGGVLVPSADTAQWQIRLTSPMDVPGGANAAGILYELLTSSVHGISLDLAVVDSAAFNTAALALLPMGLSHLVKDKGDARTLIEDILKNVQGALTINNGRLGLRLLSGGSSVLTLQADDIIALKQRPGSWYEVPQQCLIKYNDISRKFHDTILPLPGAGDYGNDEKTLQIDLPMVTDADVARLIGTRLRTLEVLPKNPDTITCGRGAFQLQFGDVFVINDPPRGYSSTVPLIAIAIREHGVGDETIEIDVVPNIFGSLPSIPVSVGGGGGGGSGGSSPITPVQLQDLVELPWDFAQDGSKQFTLFATRPQPDVEGMALYASTENPPVDYDLVDSNASFHAGGTIIDVNFSRYTMDRSAFMDFKQGSDDIEGFSSLSDSDWFGYKMLILIGSGINAGLYAARELVFLGGASWRIRGIFGPLSDTAVPSPSPGDPLWVFRIQPLYSVAGEPAWVINSLLSFKAIPFGSRISPSLGEALLAQLTILSRAQRPFPADNLVANGRGASMTPLYSTDIALAWVLRDRGFGFGYETNPSEFDPSLSSEVDTCDVEIWVSGALKRTTTVNVRHDTVQTSTISVTSAQQFTVGSVAGLQPGDRICVAAADNTGQYFGRIQSISGLTITLFSPLSVVPVADELVTRYESVGYIYDAATNAGDNGGTPAASVDIKVYPNLNGLRALRPAELTVTKQ